MKYRYSLFALLVLLFASCTNGSDEEEQEVVPGSQLSVNLSIAAEDKEGRAWADPGDPGIENQLPRYLYLFVVIEKGLNNFQVETYDGNGLCQGTWNKAVEGDETLWKYTPIILSMNTVNPGDRSKVYAIASYHELPDVQNAVVKTKEDLEKLKFYWPADNNVFSLYHVYANAKNDPANGAIIQSGSEASAKVRCNHILAKVDIQWNIAPEMMKTYAMREIKLTELPKAGYYFEPTEVISLETNDLELAYRNFNVGNQWYGRGVFYVIDRKKVHCSYTLGGTDYQGYPSQPGEALPTPAQDPNQKKFDRIYGVNTSGNEIAPGQGSASNKYTSWYRINAKFGYPSTP